MCLNFLTNVILASLILTPKLIYILFLYFGTISSLVVIPRRIFPRDEEIGDLLRDEPVSPLSGLVDDAVEAGLGAVAVSAKDLVVAEELVAEEVTLEYTEY